MLSMNTYSPFQRTNKLKPSSLSENLPIDKRGRRMQKLLIEYRMYFTRTGDDVDEMVNFFGDGSVFGLESGGQDGDSAHGCSVSGLDHDAFGRSLHGVGREERHVSERRKEEIDPIVITKISSNHIAATYQTLTKHTRPDQNPHDHAAPIPGFHGIFVGKLVGSQLRFGFSGQRGVVNFEVGRLHNANIGWNSITGLDLGRGGGKDEV